MNDVLQDKLRNFKLQVEDAEEIAALNLAKFRKAQTEVEEAEKRANLAEQAMGKLRARSIIRSETPVSINITITLLLLFKLSNKSVTIIFAHSVYSFNLCTANFSIL